MSKNLAVPHFGPVNMKNWCLGCKFQPRASLQTDMWTPREPPHAPPHPQSLYSCTPTSNHLPQPSEILGEVRTRSALVAVLYSVTAAALISPAVSRLASGANITALYWSLLTPHELNMDKHTRQLTGRQSWGGGFAATSGNHFISSRLPLLLVRAVKLGQRGFHEGGSSSHYWLGYGGNAGTFSSAARAAHLWEKLIIILEDPHFRFQLSDVVGGRIWRGDGRQRGRKSD